ncbi:MAG: ABC transporter permease [Alphaproteobacteria bacterium]|nr:ABC transporter permease [Alphaproteobacteria bacterium]MBV9904922.1 ABC transporter permease [Alphaproteobacteria bacterium]
MSATAVLPYLAILRARFALMLQYRAAAFAGFATQCWWGVIKVMVLAAFYAGHPDQPITLAQAITYTWLGQGLLGLLPWQADAEVSEAVETGNVAYERLRPVDTHSLWMARAIAARAGTTALRVVPMFVTTAILLPLIGLQQWAWQMPATREAAALFALSITLTLLLSSAFVVLLNIGVTALKTRRAANVAVTFVNPLSGMIIPLALMPGWMQGFLFWQPFAGLVDIPYRIYFGNLSGALAWQGIAAQTLWICVFILIGRAWLNFVWARVDTQGS